MYVERVFVDTLRLLRSPMLTKTFCWGSFSSLGGGWVWSTRGVGGSVTQGRGPAVNIRDILAPQQQDRELNGGLVLSGPLGFVDFTSPIIPCVSFLLSNL